MANLASNQKISVKVWEPLITKLDQKMERACLRRDAYLARVLALEVPCLDAEVVLPNSVTAQAYVAAQLETLPRKLMSLALPADLMRSLNEVCKKKRIVRDAFFNRLFLLLAAPPRAIDQLLFDFLDVDWRREVWSEYKHDGPFFTNGFYPLEPDIDPFWAIRAGLDLCTDAADLQDYYEPESGITVKVLRDMADNPMPPASIYGTVLEQKVQGNSLAGLNCYFPESRIPGHPEERRLQASLDAVLAELG
ncbi:hypothetical protein [Ramlibacter alkalitolerans]|uniref:Uncharacterized protein n=1 Tax=Ramlibacter alkalitolerans TaxID=2039631 RepID=A0ABS1JWZ6_9BURK|nr:hypothetical protein [Ramlibacter alkalitolerans]MBL0428722.1 hypothetical protein [Ramlibacter alkalitolerans]